MVPQPLGHAMIEAFEATDADLCQPQIRCRMEAAVTRIAEGASSKTEVLDRNLALFLNKFRHFEARLPEVPRRAIVTGPALCRG